MTTVRDSPSGPIVDITAGGVNSVSPGVGIDVSGTPADPIVNVEPAVLAAAALGATALQPAGDLTGSVGGVPVATVLAALLLAASALQPGGNLTGSIAGTPVATVVAGAAAGATALQPAGNLTGSIAGTPVATVVAGAAAGATALQPAGNLTGSIAGTPVATVVAGAASGATALQPAGNLTGSIAGTAVATVVAGAASGATALQPAGNLTGSIAGTAVATVVAGAASGATAVQPNTSPTLSGLTITGFSGVVKAVAGVLSAATLVNADVDAAAAIAGTKISPNFGAQDVVTTGSYSTGTNPAVAGNFRGPNGTNLLTCRNGANTADVVVIAVNSSNQITVGNSTGGLTTINGVGEVDIQVAGSIRFQVLGSSLQIVTALLTYGASQTTPVFNQSTDSSATVTGDLFTINAQDCSGTTTVTAGKMLIRGGNATGGSGTRNGGAIDVQAGTGATAEGLGRLVSGAGTARLSWNATGLGLYAAAPVAQAARVGQFTDSTTGTPSVTLVDVGAVFSQANVNNNFASVATKFNALELAIHNLGATA